MPREDVRSGEGMGELSHSSSSASDGNHEVGGECVAGGGTSSVGREFASFCKIFSFAAVVSVLFRITFRSLDVRSEAKETSESIESMLSLKRGVALEVRSTLFTDLSTNDPVLCFFLEEALEARDIGILIVVEGKADCFETGGSGRHVVSCKRLRVYL